MKKSAWRKTALDGSLTVEAALVMGLTLMVIFSLLTLTLWLRDRTVVSCALHESLYGVARTVETQLEEDLKEMYAVKGALGELSLGSDRRSASYRGNTYRFWPGISLSFYETARRDICCPPEFLRLCRAARILGESGGEEEH